MLACGHVRMGMEDYRGASACFRTLVERDEWDLEALVLSADCLRMSGRHEAALREYSRAATPGSPASLHAHFGLGASLYELGRYAEAVDAYKTCLRLEPSDQSAMVNLCSTYLELGRHEEALSTSRQLVSQWPELWDGHFALGNTYYAMGRYDGALEAYLKAASLSDGQAGLWHNMANAYCRLEQYDEAASAYKRATDIDPGRAETWLHLGGTYARNLGRFPEALQALRAGLRADPRDEDIRLEIGHTHMLAEEYEAGLASFEHAMEVNPESWRADLGMGVCLGELGRYDDAVETLHKAATLAPCEPAPHFERGVVYCSLKRKDAAMKEYEALTQLSSDESLGLASELAERMAEAFSADAANPGEEN